MMYGDYDSLLILLSPPPNNVISMTGRSNELILLYNHQKAGTPLLDPSTQDPVKDIFGKPFVCDGDMINQDLISREDQLRFKLKVDGDQLDDLISYNQLLEYLEDNTDTGQLENGF